MNSFLVKIQFWSCLEEKLLTEYGVVHAESFAAAAKIVEDTYGEDLEDVQISGLEDKGIFYLNREGYQKVLDNTIAIETDGDE